MVDTTPGTYPIEAVHLIQAEEGLRLSAYKDSRGIWTIGYGYNLEAHGYTPAEAQGITWTLAQANKALKDEIDVVVSELDRRWPTWRTLSTVRQAIIMSSVYQLGAPGAAKFFGTIDALMDHDWDRAAKQMLASRWATQTPGRVKRNAEAMRTDQWPTQVNGTAFDPAQGVTAAVYFRGSDDATQVNTSETAQEKIVTENLRNNNTSPSTTVETVQDKGANPQPEPGQVSAEIGQIQAIPSPCRAKLSIFGIPLSKKLTAACIGIVVLILNQQGIMQLSANDIAAIKDVILAYVITQGGVDIASTIKHLVK